MNYELWIMNQEYKKTEILSRFYKFYKLTPDGIIAINLAKNIVIKKI